MGTHITIASWNLYHDDTTWRERSAAAIHHITRISAHVWTLQETTPRMASHLTRETGLVEAGNPDGMNRILTTLPIIDTGHIVLDGTDATGNTYTAAWAILDAHTTPLMAISSHLAWGGTREDARFHHIQQITRLADILAPHDGITILGADFNTEPAADCHRHLRGETSTSQQYWVPVWKGAPPQATVIPEENPWAFRTARAQNIDPRRMPARATDHIYVRGWVHGRLGDPLHARADAAATPWASDHSAVVADLDITSGTAPKWHNQ